jgi:ABC-type transport system substrate-binding protein
VVRAADLVTGTIFDVRAPELKPREVRYGLNFAVDRQGIINAFMDGKVDPANQIVIKSTFGHNPNLPPFTFDVNRARQLIAQGGFPNGFNTKIGYAPIVADYKNFAEAIQQGFAQAGVRAEIELIDPAQFIPRYLALTLPVPIYMSSFSSSNYLDALEAMRFRSVPPTNAYYGNAAFDALFNQASAEIDRTRRQQILQEAMKMSHEDPPGLLGWGFAEAWGVGPRLRGFDSLPPTQLPQWQTMFRQN